MALNADILFDNLSTVLDVTRYGKNNKEQTLEHLAFFDIEKPLRTDTVYLVRPNDLLEKNIQCTDMSFVYICGNLPQFLYRDCNTLILVKNQNDILKVFSALQDIFNLYDEWDKRLLQIIASTSDIRSMIDASLKVLENPVYLVSSNYSLLVSTSIESGEDGSVQLKAHMVDKPLSLNIVLELKENINFSKQLVEPFYHKEDYYCINVFVHNIYAGFLCLRQHNRTFRQSDFDVFQRLHKLIERAWCKQAPSLASNIITPKRVIKELLDYLSIKEETVRQTLGIRDKESFICIKIKPTHNNYGFPIEYLSNEIEQLIPEAIALEHESLLVIYVQLNTSLSTYNKVMSTLSDFLSNMGLQAGVSNTFTDIMKAPYYFRQACCAIEVGCPIHPDKLYYQFSDYALPYMLVHSSGELPSRYICPESLFMLRELSLHGTVDYWETLKHYLENGMNASKTANELYLHRSTLLQRLTKINDVLKLDLRNHVQRLYIQFCIYIIEMEDSSDIFVTSKTQHRFHGF